MVLTNAMGSILVKVTTEDPVESMKTQMIQVVLKELGSSFEAVALPMLAKMEQAMAFRKQFIYFILFGGGGRVSRKRR
jgi:hypothetical protein